MKICLWATLSALLIVAPVLAGGVEDGTAGLDALNRGAYSDAVRLFTRALKDGKLSPDDREFAYFNRGQAYARKGDYKDAVADFRKAVHLKPDDTDAQNGLQSALSAVQSGSAQGDKAQAARGGDPWGVLSKVAGRYYWFPIPGKDPQFAYLHFEWATPQQVLSYSVRIKKGALIIGEYSLDQSTGKLLEAARVSNRVVYGTAETSADTLIEFSFDNEKPTKTTTKLLADGSAISNVQIYSDNSWKNTGSSMTMVEVTQETLEAQGFLKKE